MTSALRRDVEFESQGVTCRAWVYTPDKGATRPAPCIVMAHGLGGTRDAGLEPYAKRFVNAGFFVLLFDYRHLGASDGEPRQLILISRQLEDWTSAIAFARRMEGVDPRRIALWGSSFSGGHVLVAAARDRQIAAVSAQCPMVDGAASVWMVAQYAGLGAIVRLGGAALIDAVRSVLRKEPYYVPLIAPPGQLAAMSSHDAYEGCSAIVPPKWRNEVAARLLLTMLFYRPARYVRAVRGPSLIVACIKDSVASSRAAVAAAARMGDKARLVKWPIGHFDVYIGEWFERSIQEQVSFFTAHLRPRTPT
ncbi:MAG: alpha/beta hydrolase [Hyphomicrobium sp.]